MFAVMASIGMARGSRTNVDVPAFNTTNTVRDGGRSRGNNLSNGYKDKRVSAIKDGNHLPNRRQG